MIKTDLKKLTPHHKILNKKRCGVELREGAGLKKDIINNLVKETVVLAIRLYQSSLGLFLGGQCRFVPSCSEYAIEAVRQFGAVKGGYMAVKRILRCHPFGSKGFDPPQTRLKNS